MLYKVLYGEIVVPRERDPQCQQDDECPDGVELAVPPHPSPRRGKERHREQERYDCSGADHPQGRDQILRPAVVEDEIKQQEEEQGLRSALLFAGPCRQQHGLGLERGAFNGQVGHFRPRARSAFGPESSTSDTKYRSFPDASLGMDAR